MQGMWKLISQNSQTFQGKHRQHSRKFQAANTTGNLIRLPSVLLAQSAEMVISSLRLCSQILDIFKILFHLTRKHDPVPDDSLKTLLFYVIGFGFCGRWKQLGQQTGLITCLESEAYEWNDIWQLCLLLKWIKNCIEISRALDIFIPDTLGCCGY